MTRVALVHDWLTGMRGGEKVLEVFCELFPSAEIFTLVHVPGSVSPAIAQRPIHASLVQRLPRAARLYRSYLPAFPFAVEQFDLDRFDLVLSSSHCAAKAAVAPGRAKHLCYCHTPMRYAWDQFDAYFGEARVGRVRHRLLKPVLRRLARWDAATAGRVHRFIANSRHVAGRIARYYNRTAAVVYPPVDTEFFCPDQRGPGDHFLIVSALVPYKRIEVAIEAARLAGRPLRIVGDGPDRARLERQAAGADVTFSGTLAPEALRDAYRDARAVLLPGEEDFGIVPLEAQACGRPVVALARGGALETVVPGRTGVLVAEATPDAFARAMRAIEEAPPDPAAPRAHAEGFGRDRFRREIAALVEETLAAPADCRW